jgi:hypothetical protein
MGQNSPLGVNFAPGGQKFAPRGEVKNGTLWSGGIRSHNPQLHRLRLYYYVDRFDIAFSYFCFAWREVRTGFDLKAKSGFCLKLTLQKTASETDSSQGCQMVYF